jgi:hypothetical protein
MDLKGACSMSHRSLLPARSGRRSLIERNRFAVMI